MKVLKKINTLYKRFLLFTIFLLEKQEKKLLLNIGVFSSILIATIFMLVLKENNIFGNEFKKSYISLEDDVNLILKENNLNNSNHPYVIKEFDSKKDYMTIKFKTSNKLVTVTAYVKNYEKENQSITIKRLIPKNNFAVFFKLIGFYILSVILSTGILYISFFGICIVIGLFAVLNEFILNFSHNITNTEV